ncbi:hypothetical protein ACFLUU_01985 [Chloroflexota bacterium]
MTFAVQFLYDDEGELKPIGDVQEVLGEDNIRNIQNTQVGDNIRLGIELDKRTYRVTRIDRQVHGDDVHKAITVTAISDKE